MFDLICLRQVTDLTTTPYIARELMLIKIRCTAQQRGELVNLAQVRRALLISLKMICKMM